MFIRTVKFAVKYLFLFNKNSMKTVKLFFICLCTFIVLSPLSLRADDLHKSETPPIVLNTGSGGKGHRAPGISLMTGYYDAGTLAFDGIGHYGIVSVEVTHQNSGVVWCAFLDEESDSMAIGEMPGLYTIVVTTDNDTCLYGEFEID